MICPKCGSEMPDDSAFCTRCGASLHTGTQENQNSQGGPQQGNPQGTPYGYGNPQGNNGAYYGNPQMNNGMPYGQPYVDPKDHSAEFDGKDIADHKLFAMLPYLLGILGTIVALLVAKDSPYVGFHVREGIRILVSEVLLDRCSSDCSSRMFYHFIGCPYHQFCQCMQWKGKGSCYSQQFRIFEITYKDPMKKRRRFCMPCKNLLLFFVETWDI